MPSHAEDGSNISIQDINRKTCVTIQITHGVKHIPYEWVDIPQIVWKVIEDNDANTFEDVSKPYLLAAGRVSFVPTDMDQNP